LYSLLSTFSQFYNSDVRFQVLTAVSMKMTVFWAVAPCSVVEVACCIQHLGDDDSYWRSVTYRLHDKKKGDVFLVHTHHTMKAYRSHRGETQHIFNLDIKWSRIE
jgi:hypothetical protein